MVSSEFLRSHRPLDSVLARVTIQGHIHLEGAAARTINVRVGQPLVLAVPYRIREASAGKEDWKIELRSHVGPFQDAPAIVHWKDIPIVQDDVDGVLEQRYVFPEPGEYALQYEILVDYTDTRRRTGKRTQDEVQSCEGVALVKVVD